MTLNEFEGKIKAKVVASKRVCIFFTGDDPDAFGCALAMRLYSIEHCRLKPEQVEIFHTGVFSHRQNRCIRTYFNLDKFMKVVPGDLAKAKDDVWILLDSNDLEDKRFPISLEGVDIIIDHHGPSKKHEQPLVLLENVGAASTLVVELLLTAYDHDLSKLSSKEAREALTLAALGIKNDTANFTSGVSDRDTYAFVSLLPYLDNALMMDVEHYPLEERDFEILKKVLDSRELVGQLAIASAGFILESDCGRLAEIADLLIRHNQASVAVVWGIVKEKNFIRLSVRSRTPVITLNEELRAMLGGGAKQFKERGLGGAVMSLGDLAPVLEDDDYRKKLLGLAGEQIKYRFLKMLKQNE